MAGNILRTKLIKEEKEIANCGICNKTMEDPRMLDCLHTFCLKCLTSYGQDQPAGDSINCPVCKKEYKIPSGGLDCVPVNHFVSKLIRFDKYFDENVEECSVKSYCDQCLLVDQQEPAVGYCTECSEYMCNICLRKHNKSRFFATHKTSSLGEKPPVDELVKTTANNCRGHPKNTIESYCSDCKTTLCSICIHTGDHEDHKCMGIRKAAVELSKTTYEDAAKWSVIMNEADEFAKHIDSTLEVFIEQIQTVRSGIKIRYEEVKDLLKKNYKKLNENLDSIESERKKELERKRDEGKQEMLMLESLERHWNEVKARGSDCDAVQAAISLHNKSEQVVKQHAERKRAGKNTSVVNYLYSVEYVPADTLNIGSEKALLGTIKEGYTQDTHCPDWNLLLNNSQVKSFTSDAQHPYGIVIHKDHVYMTSNGTPHILVYSLQNLSTISRQISIPGLTQAAGLVYNKSDSCLYANNSNTLGRIYKINIRGDSVTGWTTHTGAPWGLSISKQKNLLVSYTSCGQIDEFNGLGQLIRSIKLADGIIGINHTVELETEEFIVCQWRPLHRICLIDSSGKVIKSYGKKRGSSVGQLNYPHYVELDQKGNILVTDCSNHKLRVLTSDLKYVADINIAEAQFSHPTFTFWDEENDRLVVTCPQRLYTITPQLHVY